MNQTRVKQTVGSSLSFRVALQSERSIPRNNLLWHSLLYHLQFSIRVYLMDAISVFFCVRSEKGCMVCGGDGDDVSFGRTRSSKMEEIE